MWQCIPVCSDCNLMYFHSLFSVAFSVIASLRLLIFHLASNMCVSVLPVDCFINGTHNDTCLNKLWRQVGCVGDITNNPSFIPADIQTFRNRDIL